MQTIIVNSQQNADWQTCGQVAEVRDENGQVLEFFSPVTGREGELYRDLEIPVTDDELRELVKLPPGRPLVDLLRDLEQ